MRDITDILRERDLLNAAINPEGLAQLAAPCPVYAGFDATADSLHVGHLVVMRVLHVMAAQGFPIIGLIGAGTAEVGDPTFRTSERTMLSSDVVRDNAAGIQRNIANLLPTGATIISNAEWLGPMGALELLRDTGQHFTLSRMLSFESVSGRVGSGLTFLEFSYMLLQARDFQELRDRFGCRIQVGGSDQWSNIICGTDLIRKTRGEDAFGITAPLLTRSDGRKMGKSGGQAVWLSTEKTDDFDFWQFWRNTPDADVAKFLRIFTDIPLDEILTITAVKGAKLNAAKIRLANAVTSWVRSPEAAQACESAAHAVAHGDGHEAAVPTVSAAAGTALFRVLVTANLADSAKAAKRAVEGGVRVNNVRVEDPNAVVQHGDLIRIGKRCVRVEAA